MKTEQEKMKPQAKPQAKTPLQQAVISWVESSDEPDAAVMSLAMKGCSSGIVEFLASGSFSLLFYETHKHEINKMLSELIKETYLSVDRIIAGWDDDDMLALENNNRILLAYYGFEETIHKLYMKG